MYKDNKGQQKMTEAKWWEELTS